MAELELALLALSVTINAFLWYRIGQLDARLRSIESNIVTIKKFRNPKS